MINQRFRNCIKLAKTLPGPDISSDHNPVKVKMKVKLKQMKKTKTREQLDLDPLKQQEYKDRYNIEVIYKYEFQNIEETPQQPEPDFIENKWKSTKTCLTAPLKQACQRKLIGKAKMDDR